MADPTGLRCQRNTRMLNPAPKNVGGRVPKPSLILTLSPQGCDKGRGLYRWPETTNIYMSKAFSWSRKMTAPSLFLYMFVVSGHLYRPLPSSQPCVLRVKIKDSFGTHPLTFLGAGLSILVFLWHLSTEGSAIWRGLRNRSDTYSFALRASPTPFAHVLALIYFGVGSRDERP